MATEKELEELADKVSTLFQGLDLEEVATVLKMQLVMLVTQGAEDADDAMDFLSEISDDVEEMIKQFPFGEDDEDGEDDDGEDDDGEDDEEDEDEAPAKDAAN